MNLGNKDEIFLLGKREGARDLGACTIKMSAKKAYAERVCAFDLEKNEENLRIARKGKEGVATPELHGGKLTNHQLRNW